MDARAANDRLVEKAEHLRFVSRVPMLCECATSSCRAIVMISIDEYRQIREDADSFLTAPGHAIRGATSQRETPEYGIQRLRADRERNGDRRSA